MTTKTDQPLRDALREACDLIESGHALCSNCACGTPADPKWRALAALPPVEPSEADVERAMRALFDARYAHRDAEQRLVKWNSMEEDMAAGWERVARAALRAGLDVALLAADAAARGGA